MVLKTKIDIKSRIKDHVGHIFEMIEKELSHVFEENDGSCVYVENLPASIDEKDLKRKFEELAKWFILKFKLSKHQKQKFFHNTFPCLKTSSQDSKYLWLYRIL